MDTLVTYSENQAAQVVDAVWELQLQVPIEVAWQRIVGEVDGWWAHCYKPGSTVLIDAVPGGRFWERFADGVNGSVYANVVYIEPPVVVKFVGQWALPGVGWSSGTWRLTEQDGGTLLRATGQVMGIVDSAVMQERKGGSESLIKALDRWVNAGEHVERG